MFCLPPASAVLLRVPPSHPLLIQHFPSASAPLSPLLLVHLTPYYRMHEEGAPVKAYSVHPGVIATGLSRHMLGGFWFGFWASVTTWIPWLGGKTVEQVCGMGSFK